MVYRRDNVEEIEAYAFSFEPAGDIEYEEDFPWKNWEGAVLN